MGFCRKKMKIVCSTVRRFSIAVHNEKRKKNITTEL